MSEKKICSDCGAVYPSINVICPSCGSTITE